MPMGPMEVRRVFLLSAILVCDLTLGSLFTCKCKWRSPANVRPKHFGHLYLRESHSLALETTFFSSTCLCFKSEISILWRCGPLIHHVEFGNALLSSSAYATFRPLIGDILFKLNPGPDTNQVNHRSSNLTFCLLNARSLRNKSVSFCDYVQDCKADIFSITETWLTQNDAAICKEITPNGYRLFHCPRTDRRGGGTALLCRESLHVRRLSAGEKTSFEFSEYVIDGLSLQLRLVIVYRPPYSAAHPVTSSTFFPEFSEYLESFVLSKVPICISGEFNVHLDVSDDADTIAFADLLESLCLTQHVKSPTHVMGHILDLIITRSSDNIIKGTPSPDCFLSDHCSVLCFLNVTKVLAIVKHINFRKLKSLDLVAFKNDIPGSDLCNIASNDCNEVA